MIVFSIFLTSYCQHLSKFRCHWNLNKFRLFPRICILWIWSCVSEVILLKFHSEIWEKYKFLALKFLPAFSCWPAMHEDKLNIGTALQIAFIFLKLEQVALFCYVSKIRTLDSADPDQTASKSLFLMFLVI